VLGRDLAEKLEKHDLGLWKWVKIADYDE